MIALRELVRCVDALLEPGKVSDYCPNGLQVEGRPEVRRLVTGVTASQALLDAAIADGADAILVHHGYFWKNEDPCITGIKARRLRTLLRADVSLLAYHLPLDLHPTLGNNAQLARLLDLVVDGPLEPGNPRAVGVAGHLATPLSPDQFGARLAERLGRPPLHVPGRAAVIRTIGFCTGAAQGYIDQAVALGLDAYLTGEVSEPTVHIARESGVHFYAAGHHATERYGVQALGDWLAAELGIEHRFIDIDNPV